MTLFTCEKNAYFSKLKGVPKWSSGTGVIEYRVQHLIEYKITALPQVQMTALRCLNQNCNLPFLQSRSLVKFPEMN